MPIQSKSGFTPVFHPYDAGDETTLLNPVPAPEDGIQYVGKATPGTETSQPGWQIRRILYVSGEVAAVLFAEGSNLKEFVWDDRATYSFS